MFNSARSKRRIYYYIHNLSETNVIFYGNVNQITNKHDQYNIYNAIKMPNRYMASRKPALELKAILDDAWVNSDRYLSQIAPI